MRGADIVGSAQHETAPDRGRGVRLLQDTALAFLLSLAMTDLSMALLRSPQGTSIINLPAGVTAGILILLPLRRWSAYLIVGAAGQFSYYAELGLSIHVTALRTLADGH